MQLLYVLVILATGNILVGAEASAEIPKHPLECFEKLPVVDASTEKNSKTVCADDYMPDNEVTKLSLESFCESLSKGGSIQFKILREEGMNQFINLALNYPQTKTIDFGDRAFGEWMLELPNYFRELHCMKFASRPLDISLLTKNFKMRSFIPHIISDYMVAKLVSKKEFCELFETQEPPKTDFGWVVFLIKKHSDAELDFTFPEEAPYPLIYQETVIRLLESTEAKESKVDENDPTLSQSSSSESGHTVAYEFTEEEHSSKRQRVESISFRREVLPPKYGLTIL